jgi:phage-related protein
MPTTKVRLFREEDGSTPILEWLSAIESRNRKTYEKCRSYLQRLSDFGRELRRPTADYLRDGVYELRIKHLGVNYRILYGFVGQDIVLVSHGITKEKKVPAKEIELAAKRIAKYHSNPERHGSNPSSKDFVAKETNPSMTKQEKSDGEGESVESATSEEFFNFVLRFAQFENVSDLVYEVISHAQDELISSPQYERMRNLLDGFEDGLIRAGVMHGERIQHPDTGEVTFQGDELFQSWLLWKIAVLSSITPPSEDER